MLVRLKDKISAERETGVVYETIIVMTSHVVAVGNTISVKHHGIGTRDIINTGISQHLHMLKEDCDRESNSNLYRICIEHKLGNPSHELQMSVFDLRGYSTDFIH